MADRDIVDLLLEDHEDFRQLFAELADAEVERRQELFRYLVARLASHEAAEEAIVHATVRSDVPGGDDIASEVLEEEASAERMLSDMDDLDPTSDAFAEALDRLRSDVLAHAEHEEQDEFPALRQHVDQSRREEMAQRFQRLRDAGPTRPHPHTPQSPVARGVAGPIVGLFDRARDAARDAFDR